MHTDADYRRHIRAMTEMDDAKALCRRELQPDAFKTKARCRRAVHQVVRDTGHKGALCPMSRGKVARGKVAAHPRHP